MPRIEPDHIRHQHINLARVVGPRRISVRMKRVSSMRPRPVRRFYLHPNQPLPVIQNQVVPRTLAPWFRHLKSQSRRLCQKRGLRHLTPLLSRQRPSPPQLPPTLPHLRISLLHSPLSPASATPVPPLLLMLDRRPIPIPVPRPLHIHTSPMSPRYQPTEDPFLMNSVNFTHAPPTPPLVIHRRAGPLPTS